MQGSLEHYRAQTKGQSLNTLVDLYYQYLGKIEESKKAHDYDSMLKYCDLSLPLIEPLVKLEMKEYSKFALGSIPALEKGALFWGIRGDTEKLEAVKEIVQAVPQLEPWGAVVDEAFVMRDLATLIYLHVKENENCLQKDLKKNIGCSDGKLISRVVYYMDHLKQIIREKKGSTYSLKANREVELDFLKRETPVIETVIKKAAETESVENSTVKVCPKCGSDGKPDEEECFWCHTKLEPKKTKPLKKKQAKSKNASLNKTKIDKNKEKFQVREHIANCKVTLIDCGKKEKGEKRKKRNWHFVSRFDSESAYVEQAYDRTIQRHNTSNLVIRDSIGVIIKDVTIDHRVIRFNTSEKSDRYVVYTEDMMLYVYSLNGDVKRQIDLSGRTSDKNHVRSVGLSPEGEYAIYTHIDTMYLLDSNLREINKWTAPPKEGWEKVIEGSESLYTEEFKTALSVFGLDGVPDVNIIKKTFRGLAVKHHPDKNPGDSSAVKKMQMINAAYEILAGEDIAQALSGEDKAYYRRVEDQPRENYGFTIELRGPGEDWIYASHVGASAETIYLGCYSGRLYCLAKDGRLLRTYNCNSVIRDIQSFGDKLYVRTDAGVFLIKEGSTFFRQTERIDARNILLKDDKFYIFDNKNITIFNNVANKMAEINFSVPLYDYYFSGNNLKIETVNETYLFNIE